MQTPYRHVLGEKPASPKLRRLYPPAATHAMAPLYTHHGSSHYGMLPVCPYSRLSGSSLHINTCTCTHRDIDRLHLPRHQEGSLEAREMTEENLERRRKELESMLGLDPGSAEPE